MEKIKIIKRGNSQILRIPGKYKIKSDDVFIKRFGNGIAILPKSDPWNIFMESLDDFTNDFMKDRTQPPLETREKPFK